MIDFLISPPDFETSPSDYIPSGLRLFTPKQPGEDQNVAAEMWPTDHLLQSVGATFEQLRYFFSTTDAMLGIQGTTAVEQRSEYVRNYVVAAKICPLGGYTVYPGDFDKIGSLSLDKINTSQPPKRFVSFNLSTKTGILIGERHYVSVLVDTIKRQVYFLDGKGHEPDELHLADPNGNKSKLTVHDFLIAFARDNKEKYKDKLEDDSTLELTIGKTLAWIPQAIQRTGDSALILEVLIELLVKELDAKGPSDPSTPDLVLRHVVETSIANRKAFYAKVNALRDRILTKLHTEAVKIAEASKKAQQAQAEKAAQVSRAAQVSNDTDDEFDTLDDMTE